MKRSVAFQICKLYEKLTLIKNCHYKRLYLARKVFFETNYNIRGVRYLDNKLSYVYDRINNYFSTSEVSKPTIEDTTNYANEIYDFNEIKNNLNSLHEFVSDNIKCLNEDELDESDKDTAEESSEDESDEDCNATVEEFNEDEFDEYDNVTYEESTFFGFPKNSNEKWESISNELDRDSQFMFKFLLKCKTIIVELKKFIQIIYKIFFFANQLLYLWLNGKNDDGVNYENEDDNERIQNYRKRIRVTGKFKCDIRKLFKMMKNLSFSTETLELIVKLNSSSSPISAVELQTTPCTSPFGSTYSRESWIQKPRELASGHVRSRRSEHVTGTSSCEESERSTLDVSEQISEKFQSSGGYVVDVGTNVTEIIGECATCTETSPENCTTDESCTKADTNEEEKEQTLRTTNKRKIEDTDINATIRNEKKNKTNDLADSRSTIQLDSVEQTYASGESSSTSPINTRDKEMEREASTVASVNTSTIPMIETMTIVSNDNNNDDNFENDSTNRSVVSMQLEHEAPLNEKVPTNDNYNNDDSSIRDREFLKTVVVDTTVENELDARETVEATNNLQQLYPPNLTKTTNVVQWTQNGMLDPSLMLPEENFLENIYIDNDIYMDTSSRQYLKLPVFNDRDEELNVIVNNAIDNVLGIAATEATATDAASIEQQRSSSSSLVSTESSKVDVSVRWFVRDSLRHVKLEPLFDSWNFLDNNSNICILTYQNLELYVIFNGVKSCLNRSILKQFKKCKLNDFHMIIATNLGKQIGKHILIIKHNLSSKNLNTVISILENAKKVVSFMKAINAESDGRHLYESSEKSALIFYSESNDCIIGFKNEYIRKFGVWGKLYRRDACYVKICCRGNGDRYINCGLVKVGKTYDRIKDFVGEEIKLYGSIIVKFADFKNNIVVHAKLFVPKENRDSQSVMYINKTDDICYIDDIAYNSQDYTNYIDGL